MSPGALRTAARKENGEAAGDAADLSVEKGYPVFCISFAESSDSTFASAASADNMSYCRLLPKNTSWRRSVALNVTVICVSTGL